MGVGETGVDNEACFGGGFSRGVIVRCIQSTDVVPGYQGWTWMGRVSGSKWRGNGWWEIDLRNDSRR